MKVGVNLRKVRELKGFTQEYMASELEISQRNYSRLEKDEVELTLSRLSKISEILEVTPSQILGFDEKFFFSNCDNAYGATNQNNYSFSEKEREQYESQINHLNGEVVFLRNQLEELIKK
ncbi:MAG: transcriptional regulator with XRE-family HTH domain [Vicingaceae bacterium]|jgi:transcriptional regulator with XRE-family HTH domain